MVSAEKILSFPDPFVEKNVYRYSNNAIPLNPPIAIEVTESYNRGNESEKRAAEKVPTGSWMFLKEIC